MRFVRIPPTWRRGRLNVTDAVSEVNGGIVFGTQKSHRARCLRVPAFLLQELRDGVARRGPDDLAFPSPQGSALQVQNFRRGYFEGLRRRQVLRGGCATRCAIGPAKDACASAVCTSAVSWSPISCCHC